MKRRGGEIDLKHLQCFLVVAETLGMRRAAERLGLPQSAVSARIRAIEDRVGVSLFERDYRGVRLTGEGKTLFEQVRPPLRDLNAALDHAREAGKGANGNLKLGIVASLSRGVLRDALADFRPLHSDVEVSLIEGERELLMGRLRERRLDLVYAAGAHPVPGIEHVVLASEQVIAALCVDHRFATLKTVELAELSSDRFVLAAREPGPEIRDYIVQRLGDLGRPLRLSVHDVQRETLMNMVGLGFGISVVAEDWIGCSYPGVVFRPTSDTIPFSAWWLAENDNPALRRFLSLARLVSRRSRQGASTLSRPHIDES